MKAVSIVIPTFNRADLLPETIDACLQQTHECEVIICDHGSTDNTSEVISQYASRVKYIRRERDFGPHYCWLEGIINASSDIIHLQYDDDLITNDFIEKTLALLNDDVGFVFTDCDLFYPDGKSGSQFANVLPDGVIEVGEAERFVLESMISPGCVLIRKKDAIDALYQGSLPFSDNEYHGVGPDHFFTLLCLLRYPKIAFINEPLARFRVHKGSITIQAYSDQQKKQQIKSAYGEVKKYYKILKQVKERFY